MRPSRRELLVAAGALGALPGVSWAFGDKTRVDIAEITLGTTLSRPNAWKRLLYEVIQTTSVESVARSVAVKPEDLELFEHPFSVLIGRESFPEPSEEAVEQLSRYLSYGGFLFIDDASGVENSDFDESVRALCSRLFPTRPLAPVPADHSLYRSFFLIDQPVGRLKLKPYLEAVSVGNLSPLVYCRNDLSGALERGDDGRPTFSCVPGGELQRREAIKLGINLVLYSLTANYKKDQAHVSELMREGRLE